MKKNTIWTIVSLVLVIAIIYVLLRHSNFVIKLLQDSGPLAPVVAIILYPALAPTPITADPITLLMGATYGPCIGILIGAIGNILAVLVEYYVGLKIGSKTNFFADKEKMPFGLGKVPVDSIPFLVFGRMIPGYGSKIISLIAGAYKVPMKRYLWTSAVMAILGSILLSLGGYGLIKLIRI